MTDQKKDKPPAWNPDDYDLADFLDDDEEKEDEGDDDPIASEIDEKTVKLAESILTGWTVHKDAKVQAELVQHVQTLTTQSAPTADRLGALDLLQLRVTTSMMEGQFLSASAVWALQEARLHAAIQAKPKSAAFLKRKQGATKLTKQFMQILVTVDWLALDSTVQGQVESEVEFWQDSLAANEPPTPLHGLWSLDTAGKIMTIDIGAQTALGSNGAGP